jgi:predicted GIY-YIG superfamily endonuclease
VLKDVSYSPWCLYTCRNSLGVKIEKMGAWVNFFTKMTSVYVIKCSNDKYYIGRTNHLENRLEDHSEGNGSSWTKMYKPIKVEKIIPNCSAFEEDKLTKEYMSAKGIDNVRGGSYSNINLTSNQKQLLTTEIRNATDACIQCGNKGHYIRNCPSKNTKGESEEESEDESEEESEEESGDEYDDEYEEEFEEESGRNSGGGYSGYKGNSGGGYSKGGYTRSGYYSD